MFNQKQPLGLQADSTNRSMSQTYITSASTVIKHLQRNKLTALLHFVVAVCFAFFMLKVERKNE